MQMQDHDHRDDPPVLSCLWKPSVPSARCMLISDCRFGFCLVHFLCDHLEFATVWQKLLIPTRFLLAQSDMLEGNPDFLFPTQGFLLAAFAFIAARKSYLNMT
jgi:hypothetical protein